MQLPGAGGDADAAAVADRGRVQHLAVDVELALVGRAVADPDRAGAAVALQVGKLALAAVRVAVDAVEDLRPGAVVPLVGQPQPADEVERLVVVADRHQREEGKRAVAQPAEAVVPVPDAADPLGQRSGRRRDDRAGRLVGQELERQRAAHDLIPVRPPVRALLRPALPVAERSLEPGGQVGRPQRPRGRVAVPAVGQGQGAALAGAHAPHGPDGPLAVRLERPAGRGQGQPVAGAVRQRAGVRHELEAGRLGRVAVGRLEERLELDLAVDPVDQPDDLAVAPDVVARPLRLAAVDRHEVGQPDAAGPGPEDGVEHVGRPAVAPPGRVDGGRADLEVAAAAGVEQAAERGRPVEPPRTEPVDRSLARDQRGGVAVADDSVVGDREVAAHGPHSGRSRAARSTAIDAAAAGRAPRSGRLGRCLRATRS